MKINVYSLNYLLIEMTSQIWLFSTFVHRRIEVKDTITFNFTLACRMVYHFLILSAQLICQKSPDQSHYLHVFLPCESLESSSPFVISTMWWKGWSGFGLWIDFMGCSCIYRSAFMFSFFMIFFYLFVKWNKKWFMLIFFLSVILLLFFTPFFLYSYFRVLHVRRFFLLFHILK